MNNARSAPPRRGEVDLGKLHAGRKYNRQLLRQKVPWYQNSFEQDDVAPTFDLPSEPMAMDPPLAIPKELRPLGYKPRYLRTIQLIDEPLPPAALPPAEYQAEKWTVPTISVHCVPFEKTRRSDSQASTTSSAKSKPRLTHSMSFRDLPRAYGPAKRKTINALPLERSDDDEEDEEDEDEDKDEGHDPIHPTRWDHSLHSIKTMGKLSPLPHHVQAVHRKLSRAEREHSRRVSIEESQDLRNSESYFGPTAKPRFFAQYRHLYSKPYLFVEDPALATDRDVRDRDGYLSIPSSTRGKFIPAYPSSSYLQSIEKGLAAVGSGVEFSDSALPIEDKLSPRSQYLTAGVVRPELAVPFMMRHATTKVYDFSFQSLGDELITEFAKCLKNELPYVEEINVRDNRLSDDGLNALLQAITRGSTMLRLHRLDISQNTIGAASAQTLRSFIVSSSCTLRALLLDNADIDDRECALFMTAFEKNLSIRELWMTRNSIGKSEHLNVVQPDFVTGGEVIASMLHCNLVLLHLDISWNYLRLESSITLARSIMDNRTLVELNLAYNACGDAGAMVFGEALLANQCLEVLDLSYNSIGCKGAQVLALAVRGNHTLRSLKLDGNCLGREGGQALLFALCENRNERGLELSLHACNLSNTIVVNSHAGVRASPSSTASVSGTTEYNVASWPAYGGSSGAIVSAKEPTGRYILQLSEPYDRMIASELVRIAVVKKGCRFLRVDHRTAPGAAKKPVNLVRRERKASSLNAGGSGRTPEGEDPLETLGLDALFAGVDCVDHVAVMRVLNRIGLFPKAESLESVLARLDSESSRRDDFASVFFHAVFQLLDSDASGKIDADEVEEAFRMLGIAQYDEREIVEAIAAYDLSGDGEMEEYEFVAFLKDKLLARIKLDLLGSDAVKNDGAVSTLSMVELLDAATQKPWRIPDTGVLEIDFLYEREAFASDEEAHRMAKLPHSAIDQLVHNIMAQAQSKSEQAELFDVAVRDSELRFTASQAYHLLEACALLTGSVERKLSAIARILPQLLTPREAQVLVARTLTLRERCRLKAALGSAYSVVLGNPTAHYSLDLSKPCDRAALAKIAEIAQHEKLFSRHKSGHKDTSQHGNWENFRNEELDGEAVVLSAASFHVMPRQGKLSFDYVSTTRPKKGMAPLSERRFAQLLQELEATLTIPTGDDAATRRLVVDDDEDVDEFAEEGGEMNALGHRLDSETPRVSVPSSSFASHFRFSPPPLTKTLSRRTKRTEYWDKTRSSVLKKAAWHFGKTPSVRGAGGTQAPSLKEIVALKLVQLEAAVCDRWLSCAQASRLVGCLPPQLHARAEAARLLFARIIDIDQFYVLFDSLLSREDQYVCAKAIGWLNLVNPMAPERAYSLDLSIGDERAMTQLLVQLAIAEPGENWINQHFSMVRGEPGIPGWKLPVRWEKEDDEGSKGGTDTGTGGDGGGVNRCGYLEMEYYSGADRGCAPVPSFRKTLMNRVLAGTKLYC